MKVTPRWRGISQDGNFGTLERFSGQVVTPAYATDDWMRENAALVAEGATIDTETTGLNSAVDEIIELGIRRFRFHRETGEILRMGESLQSFQEPSRPLTPEIIELTGIQPEDVKGKSIDWTAVARFLEPCSILVAHNAGFDRPFVDARLPLSTQKLWGCSYAHVDWNEKGFPASKLEVLALYHGFFYDAHRALTDADVLLNLISQLDARTGAPYFQEIWVAAQKGYVEVVALGSPFESKDALKARGYRWDAERRAWKRSIPESAKPAEVEWLEGEVYHGPFRGSLREIPANAQFRRAP